VPFDGVNCEGWLANRSSGQKAVRPTVALPEQRNAMEGNLRLDPERRLVDQTGIEPVTS
jgi:hypothetical protein